MARSGRLPRCNNSSAIRGDPEARGATLAPPLLTHSGLRVGIEVYRTMRGLRILSGHLTMPELRLEPRQFDELIAFLKCLERASQSDKAWPV
jgi:hypothetical protein